MVVARSKIRFSAKLFLAAAVLFTGVTIALAAIGIGPRFTQVTGKGSVAIPAADLHRGDIRFFSWRDDAGKDIRFILGRDGAGRVLADFDACQQCSHYRKGYTSSGGYLVCRFCGNRYRLDATATGLGSCAPVRLPIQVKGDSAIVNTPDLKAHRDLF